MDNSKILNAIRLNASQEYKDRIPTATQSNLSKIADIMTNYPTTKNEFINALTNQLASTIFFTKRLENKLKFFHKGELPFGSSLQGVFTDIIKGKSFSENFGDGTSEASSLLAKEKTDNIKVEYYEQNFQHKYKITISDLQLRNAFNNPNGLSTLLNQMLLVPLNSSELDEYVMMKTALEKGKYKSFEVEEPVDEKTSKNFCKTLRTIIGTLGFPSKEYNQMGVTTWSSPSDLLIITTAQYQAELDIEVLAYAYNLSSAEIQSRIVLIDGFEDKDRIALVIDKDLVQFYDTLSTTKTQENADLLTTNSFLHKWGICCLCNFANAIELKKAKSS